MTYRKGSQLIHHVSVFLQLLLVCQLLLVATKLDGAGLAMAAAGPGAQQVTPFTHPLADFKVQNETYGPFLFVSFVLDTKFF